MHLITILEAWLFTLFCFWVKLMKFYPIIKYLLQEYNRVSISCFSFAMDSSAPADLHSLTSSQKEQLIEQMKQEVALATTQALLQNMSDICFKKCISKPGTSLDNSEQKCVATCMDRYVDSWNLVSKTFAARIRRESSRM
ncbi:Mitochondrial import inner membrane translocase [Fasciola hepatica]|uniref:Mitochondrial import inner membrane translocase subunit n=2 Tax=Fasciola TaxID=6191 RepID=A0A4E0QUP3_FASHE|nr:Mitochondrial import inner membrane translocase [Fasciola hepatica]